MNRSVCESVNVAENTIGGQYSNGIYLATANIPNVKVSGNTVYNDANANTTY